MEPMFTPNIIFIKHAELKEMDEKWLEEVIRPIEVVCFPLLSWKV